MEQYWILLLWSNDIFIGPTLVKISIGFSQVTQGSSSVIALSHYLFIKMCYSFD